MAPAWEAECNGTVNKQEKRQDNEDNSRFGHGSWGKREQG